MKYRSISQRPNICNEDFHSVPQRCWLGGESEKTWLKFWLKDEQSADNWAEKFSECDSADHT